jgi:beta-N-acetylhexosaminidase
MEQYLLPFRALCEKADGIMMSNIVYRNVDSLPAVLSPKIAGMARGICGENLLITDDLWAVSLRSFVHPDKPIHKTHYPDDRFSRITELAVRAGNDMLMITYPKKVPLMIRTIREMAKKDPKIKQRVDESVLRILKAKEKIGADPE